VREGARRGEVRDETRRGEGATLYYVDTRKTTIPPAVFPPDSRDCAPHQRGSRVVCNVCVVCAKRRMPPPRGDREGHRRVGNESERGENARHTAKSVFEEREMRAERCGLSPVPCPTQR
jgi:hypothetical protein